MPRESEVEELMREVDRLTRDINRWLGISDRRRALGERIARKKKKRKLSAWNKFVKANAKKPRFRLRSGAPNLKKLGVAFRKTPAGRKKRR
jgi:hypothetical protein